MRLGIIELSSLQVVSVIIDKEKLERKKIRLHYFKNKTDFIPNFDQIIRDQTISISKFKNNVLPIIIRHIKFCSFVKPVVLKILCRGVYYSATNSKEVFTVIENEIKKHRSHLLKLIVEPLSPSKASYYGFISFLRTTRINREAYSSVDIRLNELYFIKNKSLHVNINNDTTELSIFKGENFNPTYSLSIGIINIYNSILNINLLTVKSINEVFAEYSLKIQEELRSINTSKIDVYRVCISSGIAFLIDGFEYEQERNEQYLYSLLENEIQNLPKRLHSLRKNNATTQSLQRIYISKVAGLFIAFEISKVYENTTNYLNYANTSIGAIYSLLEK